MRGWLLKQGFTISDRVADYISWIGSALAIIILAFAANYVAKRFLLGQAVLTGGNLVFCQTDKNELG